MVAAIAWSIPATGDETTRVTSKPVRLEYDAPAECPSRASLVREIWFRAPWVTFGERRTRRTFVVQIQRNTRGLTGELLVRDRPGGEALSVRRLSDGSCSDLVRAMGFFAALTLEREGAGVKGREPARVNAPDEVSPEPSEAQADDEPERALHSLRIEGGVGAGLASGLGIATASIAAGFVGLSWERPWLFSPAARIGWVATSTETTRTVEGSVRTALRTADVSVCPILFRLGRGELRPCAFGELGARGIQSSFIVGAKRFHDPWLALGVLGRVSIPLFVPMRLEVEAGAAAPLGRARYVFQPTGALAFQAAPLGFRGQLSLIVRLP